jgi:CheY-like chemotaxis protein
MHTKGMFQLAPDRELPVVLLIDDDLVSREVSATLLTMSGYSVHTAESGPKALEMLDGGACLPGVILMDVQLPGLSGNELIAAFRARTRAQVYLVSASDLPPGMVADGFLRKPFDADALRRLLEKRKPEAGVSFLDAQQPVISVEILSKLRKMMPEPAVRQIYLALVADLGRRIAALEAAMAQKDAAEVRRIGHAIKGGCGMAGAMQAARLGALLEALPAGERDNQLDNSAALVRDLRAAAQGLQRMLDAELPA